VEFFQSDPRLLKLGLPEVIIAQSPSQKNHSQRSLETVAPLAKALGLPIISRFTFGQVQEMVQWLKSQREYDGKTALICMNHMEIAELAKALGVVHLRPRVWPHETYDRLYVLTFAPENGRFLSLQNLTQTLLFGDSFQALAGPEGRAAAEVAFKQVYQTGSSKTAGGKESPGPRWQFSATAKVQGDFSDFNDDTIPVFRVGGFCFGYHLTTLGYLKKQPNAVVKTDASKGSGSLLYRYQTVAAGAARTYAWISFAWDRQSLRVEFQADVDEGSYTPEIDLPIVLENDQPVGLIVGAAPCYVALGRKRFQAPIGFNYQGEGRKASTPSPSGSYQATLRSVGGFLLERAGDPDNIKEIGGPGAPAKK
jgi:hypothetical protein